MNETNQSHIPAQPNLVTLAEAVRELWAQGANKGQLTGLADVDDKLGGLHKGEMVVLAARPGMGKTALATSVMMSIAAQGGRVLFFSLEMPRKQIAMRVLCSVAGVPLQALRQRDGIQESIAAQLAQAEEQVKAWPFSIDDSSAVTIDGLRERAALYQGQNGDPALIVVDYLQLVRPSRRHGNREQEVSEISAGLKAIAKDLDAPVLALAQLSRACELRTNKRPVLSDLRDSGSIEQDADAVMFLYRERYYEPSRTDEDEEAEVIIAKQRNGPVGTCWAHFSPPSARFY